ncbi:putative fimbrial chaperone protein ElfD precursor [Photorhabdus australis subsp. thailandensis]|uniref:Putative fimbrial chaperone protein ElfD n=1 Tax=Photorhabdus australis subsp. thailandensis TaxID=2805096 RepID=A0A1C0U8A3_9GAMM|nr:molecular chaperone [Photorhabdus australis]OCQ54170.1 putative fimbrial chaperone protein ElfD precursor [Photorhabdus australis subsp. thailandensis]
MAERKVLIKQRVTSVLCALAMISPVLPLRAEESLDGVLYINDARVIYFESFNNGVPSTFINNSDSNYLIQSTVRELDPATGLPLDAKAPFIVIPPIARVDAHERQVLKILRTGGDFPKDRESLFFLNVRMLPSEKPLSASKGFSGKVKMTTALAVKVFYRPEGLPKEGVAGAVKQLSASVKESVVTLTNPSPFWLTLQALQVNSFAVPDQDLFRMVPPFGQQSWSLPVGKVLLGNHVTVSWRAIGEFGLSTDEESRSIAVSDSG